METLSNKAPTRKQLENRITELEKLLDHSICRGEELQRIVDHHRKVNTTSLEYINQVKTAVSVTLKSVNESATVISEATRHVSEEELSASMHKIQTEVQKQAGVIIDCQNLLNAVSVERDGELLNTRVR